jgi:single-strand DNA-binding protein
MKKDEVDFINCIAWEKTAEIIGEYCSKGNRIAIVGRIQTGSYDKDGTKVYTTDIIINSVQLLGEKKNNTENDVDEIFPY